MQRILPSGLIALAILTTCASAFAAPCKERNACDPACTQSCGDVAFPSAARVDDTLLCLNGMGIREATVFNVDVYVAGLYLQKRSNQGEAIARLEQPKLMRLRFVRDVSRSEISEAIAGSFERSAGASFAKLKPSIDRLTAALPALKTGDSLTLQYRPGRGLEVSHGSKLLVAIPGAEFAAVLFRIWLGQHPPNAGLRTGLLGGQCG